MRIGDDWLAVLKHAWSVRFNALAAAATGAQMVVPLLAGVNLPLWFTALVFLLIAAGTFSRFVVQEKVQ